MRKLILSALFVMSAGVAFADPVEGIWKTTPDDNGNYGHIDVKACGAKICGTLIKAFDSAGKAVDSPNVGKQIIWDMEPQGDGYYDNGKVWSPDRDKTYNSNMTLSGNSLGVKGCVAFICRDGGTWTRVN